jgi:hypothetical protein
MASHRFEIDTTAGPAREGILGGRAMLLVRVRLFDGPGVVDGATGQLAGEQERLQRLASRRRTPARVRAARTRRACRAADRLGRLAAGAAMTRTIAELAHLFRALKAPAAAGALARARRPRPRAAVEL